MLAVSVGSVCELRERRIYVCMHIRRIQNARLTSSSTSSSPRLGRPQFSRTDSLFDQIYYKRAPNRMQADIKMCICVYMYVWISQAIRNTETYNSPLAISSMERIFLCNFRHTATVYVVHLAELNVSQRSSSKKKTTVKVGMVDMVSIWMWCSRSKNFSDFLLPLLFERVVW